jgi:hypothetical protein
MKTIKCDVKLQYMGFVQEVIEKNTKYTVKTCLIDGMKVKSEKHFTNQNILKLGILIGKAIILKDWTENDKLK